MQGIQHPEVVMREENSYHVLRVTPRDCRTETRCRNQSAAILIGGDRNGEETGHSVASRAEACRLSTLPWPEIPLLSTSKQHGVQGGKFTDPSYIQSTNPGTVELEGKASHLLSGNCLVTCSACV